MENVLQVVEYLFNNINHSIEKQVIIQCISAFFRISIQLLYSNALAVFILPWRKYHH